MPTPRFLRPLAPSYTSQFAGLESAHRAGLRGGLSDWGYNLKNTAASRALTLYAPVASVNIGTPLDSGGSVLTFYGPRSFGSLYTGGASMGPGAEYLRLRNAQTQNYLARAST